MVKISQRSSSFIVGVCGLRGAMAYTIPKPKFVNCDETSLTIKFSDGPSSNSGSFPPPGKQIFLEYKEPPVPWEEASFVLLNASGVIREQDVQEIANLKPGTPYFVRLLLVDEQTGITEYGPETVFDTKPVDCGPKGKKKGCTIS